MHMLIVILFCFVLCYHSAFGRNANILDLTTFKQQNILCHNTYREKHGVHPLTYNAKLNKEAQDYAEQLASFDSFSVYARINASYGINLFGDVSADTYTACDYWYEEHKKYKYDKDQPNNLNEVGHFTQMVSRASCFMGAGIAKSKSGRSYIVILYYPMGNVENEYQRNVFLPGTNRHKTTVVDAMMRKVACTDSDRETYLNQNLECHNVVREKYKVGPLAYSDKLNEQALEKAEWLARRGTGLNDRNNKPVKDFRVIFHGGLIDGYNYCQHVYNYGRQISIETLHGVDSNEDISEDTLGFPQMIWKSTRYMGFGMARSNNGDIYIVVAYDPLGNVRGQFRKNVFEPTNEDKEWLSPNPDSWERF